MAFLLPNARANPMLKTYKTIMGPPIASIHPSLDTRTSACKKWPARRY